MSAYLKTKHPVEQRETSPQSANLMLHACTSADQSRTYMSFVLQQGGIHDDTQAAQKIDTICFNINDLCKYLDRKFIIQHPAPVHDIAPSQAIDSTGFAAKAVNYMTQEAAFLMGSPSLAGLGDEAGPRPIPSRPGLMRQ